jgi:predicted nucleotide-binding protein
LLWIEDSAKEEEKTYPHDNVVFEVLCVSLGRFKVAVQMT